MPVAIKDIVDVAGIPTTAGAHQRFHRFPQQDALLAARLRAAGAVFVGKTNLHEFAYGVTNINPHFGPTRNPWDPSCIPGGSSGGSAAAVAAGLCAAAVGTDTGGSIRIPASLCGIVGIKPTFGRVEVTGIVPLSWTLDHAGPLTRTVRDAALLLWVTAGGDGRVQPVPGPPFDGVVDRGISGLRVGVPRSFFWERLITDVQTRAEAALGVLRRLGAVVSDVEVPHAAETGSAASLILAVEAATLHEDSIRSHPEAYGIDLRTRLERGLFVPASDYVTAQRARGFLTRECRRVLADVDVLVMPTTVTAATPIEEGTANASGVSLAMSFQLTRCTNPFNLTGLPALSVPCGFTSQGLPVGLQIVGKPWDEATVLRVGHAYEQATPWHTRRPPSDEEDGIMGLGD